MTRRSRAARTVCVIFVVFGAAVAFGGAPARVSAQTAAPSFAGQGGQMPDPKAISGTPLPVTDLPVGTVTARVIRGQFTNPLEGETVRLAGAGATRTARTDAAGRATFVDLPPGARVTLSVTVAGETIASREFDVPASGGVRVMLVATDAATEQRAAEDRKLAAGPPIPGDVVLGDQSRVVLEIVEDALNVFNLMQIVNTAKRPVQAAQALVFDLPKMAVGAGLLEGSTDKAVVAGSRVTVTGPFPPGATMVQFAYSIPLGDETIRIDERMPAALSQVTVVAQKTGGMQIFSPQLKERREMAADGQSYLVGRGDALRAGDTLSLTISGLPHRATWPRNVALALAAIVIGAGVWGSARGGPAAADAARRRQLESERDALFGRLAALEAERRRNRIDGGAYAARREALVTALEDLYAGLDREAVA